MVDKQVKQSQTKPGSKGRDSHVREVAQRVVARREKALRELGDR